MKKLLLILSIAFFPIVAFASVFNSAQLSTTTATNGYYLQTNGTNNLWVPISASSTNYWTLSGSNLYNNSGTNVGIDTASPSQALDVNGGIQIESSNPLYFFNTGTFIRASGGNIEAQSNSGSLARILTGPGGAYYPGSVGIGTSSPSNLLEVNGNGYFSGNVTAANITATGTLTLPLIKSSYLATNQSGVIIATTTPVLAQFWTQAGATTTNTVAKAASTLGIFGSVQATSTTATSTFNNLQATKNLIIGSWPTYLSQTANGGLNVNAQYFDDGSQRAIVNFTAPNKNFTYAQLGMQNDFGTDLVGTLNLHGQPNGAQTNLIGLQVYDDLLAGDNRAFVLRVKDPCGTGTDCGAYDLFENRYLPGSPDADTSYANYLEGNQYGNVGLGDLGQISDSSGLNLPAKTTLFGSATGSFSALSVIPGGYPSATTTFQIDATGTVDIGGSMSPPLTGSSTGSYISQGDDVSGCFNAAGNTLQATAYGYYQVSPTVRTYSPGFTFSFTNNNDGNNYDLNLNLGVISGASGYFVTIKSPSDGFPNFATGYDIGNNTSFTPMGCPTTPNPFFLTTTVQIPAMTIDVNGNASTTGTILTSATTTTKNLKITGLTNSRLLALDTSGNVISTTTSGGGGGSGTVNSGTANQVGYYATTGTTISGTPTVTISTNTTGVTNALSVSSTTANSSFAGNLSVGSTTLPIASSTFYVDSVGHHWTGGAQPTCTTGCTMVGGDDNNMRVLAGSSVTSITIAFANTWFNPASTTQPLSPICGANDESLVSTGVEASSTPTTVVLTLPTALTSKNIGIFCKGSMNLTF